MKCHLSPFQGVLAALTLVAPFAAAPAAGGADRLFDEPCADCLALSDAALNEARGGLALDNGVLVSFGLEQSLRVNGELASATTLNTSFTRDGLGDIDLQRSGSNLLQIGKDNALSNSAFENLGGGLGTVIQNSACSPRWPRAGGLSPLM